MSCRYMKRFLLIILVFIISSISAQAEFGIWASAIYLQVNGSSQFYNTQLLTGDPNAIGPVNFGGNLGTFGQNSGSLKIQGAENKTFKNNGGNVCGDTLFYTTYLQGFRPASPVFSKIIIGFYCDCNGGIFPCGGGTCSNGDQKWQNVLQNIDLTTSPIGNYTLEIYYAASGDPLAGLCSQTHFDSNNGQNYVANYTISTVVPLHFLGLSGIVINNYIKVKWGIEDDANIIKYELQKSDNGLIFSTIGTVNSNRTTSAFTYADFDYNPLVGTNYYRIKIFHDNNIISLSNIIRFYYGSIGNTIFIYPNPSVDELIVRLVAIPRGTYRMSVFTTDGQQIASMPLVHNGMDITIKMHIPVTLSKGIYRLLLIDKVEFYKQSFMIK